MYKINDVSHFKKQKTNEVMFHKSVEKLALSLCMFIRIYFHYTKCVLGVCLVWLDRHLFITTLQHNFFMKPLYEMFNLNEVGKWHRIFHSKHKKTINTKERNLRNSCSNLKVVLDYFYSPFKKIYLEKGNLFQDIDAEKRKICYVLDPWAHSDTACEKIRWTKTWNQ